ncbi:hypothetical protein ABI59_23690 [Acidobacteria bacterium Mor1]|nr:hypothetical protein ABI59_23690 [Acidobacteria bacterium Mor1]
MEEGSAPDQQLIEAVLGGDTEAFSELVRRYQRMVGSVAWRYGIRREDIEDVVNEVFIKVFRNLHRYRPDHPFSTWLYRLAVNHSVDFTRRRRRDRLQDEFPEQMEDPTPSQSSGVEQDEDAALLRAALNEVSPKYQEALKLVYIEGLKVEDAARALAVPVGTVKTRLMRGREALRKILVRRNPGHFGGEHALP